MNLPASRNGLSISDLHLGQVGSEGHHHLCQLTGQLKTLRPAQIYLNGDTIEVTNLKGTRQQILQKLDRMIPVLEDFIKEAVAQNPSVKIHYIFGNHDVYRELEERVQQLQQKYPQNMSLHESHVKTANAIHLHGDLQVDFPYLSNKEHLKAGFIKRNITTQMGLMKREEHADDKTQSVSHRDSQWHRVQDRTGWRQRFLGKKVTFAKNVLDTTVSLRVMSLDKVVRTIYDTIKAHEPELLENTQYVLLGHYHPPGKPVIEHQGIQFIFTGPSTILKNGPAYSYDIDAQGGFSNFQPIELKRHISSLFHTFDGAKHSPSR